MLGWGDIRATLLYVFSWLTVRIIPEVHWSSAARWLTVFDRFRRENPQRYQRYLAGYRAVHGAEVPEREIRALFKRAQVDERRSLLCVTASRRKHAWNPEVKLAGRERLIEALSRGRGAILWFDNLPLGLVGKMALAQARQQMWYLTAYGHGQLSYTRFSQRLFNWRRTDVERRHLAGQIMVDSDSLLIATQRILEILDRNGIVGISNNAAMGRTISASFEGTAQLMIARALFSIAVARGAALLLVAVVEVTPFSRFEVRIGPEIHAPLGDDNPTVAMASAYVRYVLPLAKRYCDKWDWGSLTVAP
jgi:hypothetical protein